MFDESWQGFGRLVQTHHTDGFLLEVDLTDSPVGPEKIINHIQVRYLAKKLQLILDWVKEDGIDSMDNVFLEGDIDSGVRLEKY